MNHLSNGRQSIVESTHGADIVRAPTLEDSCSGLDIKLVQRRGIAGEEERSRAGAEKQPQ